MQSSVTRPRVVPPRVVSARVRPAGLPAAAASPDAARVFRRVAAGALMTVVFVGGTAGTALAVESPSAESLAVTSPTVVPSAASEATLRTQTTVFSWPTASTASSTKSTAVRVIPADQGVVHRAGTATRVAAVWAVAATLAAAGVLAGSLLRR